MNRHIEELRADQLRVDPLVQRGEPPRHTVEAMIKKWSRDATGVLTASLRNDGCHYLLDGQTRREAALECDQSFLFVVEVHEGLSIAEEIDLFEFHNKNRRQVSAIDLLRLRVTRGREPYGTIGVHLARRNLRLGNGNRGTSNVISAAQPIEWLVTRPNGKRLLPEVLDIVMAAYPSDETRWRGVFLHGVAQVIAAAHTDRSLELDPARLVRVIQQYMPRLWEQKAQVERLKLQDPDAPVGSGSSSLGTVVARLIIERYNKRLKSSNQIPWVE